MKILCVTPSYWPAFKFGGPIYSVHGLNKALVKKGIDVTVYTTNVGLDGNSTIQDTRYTIHDSQLEVELDGVKVTYFGFAKFLEFFGKAGWQFSMPITKALKKQLDHFDIVYIISVWNFPSAVAAYYCKKYRKPYIISPRGLLYPFTIGEKAFKKLLYYYLVGEVALKGAAAIHYTTDDEAGQCHSFLGLRNRSIVIPNGIDLSEFANLPMKESLRERYPALKDKKVILFLGRINWKKGLDILVRAYAKLARERNDVHLLIAGNDEENYGTKVKHWLKEYGLKYDDTSSSSQHLNISTSISKPSILNLASCILHRDTRVTFTGMLMGKEKLEAYAGSDIFVLPSYSENFGIE